MRTGSLRSIILGDDGVRYTFTLKEWQSDDAAPEVDMRVDFEVRDSQAVGIYPIPDPIPTPPATPAVPASAPLAASGEPPTPPPAASEAQAGATAVWLSSELADYSDFPGLSNVIMVRKLVKHLKATSWSKACSTPSPACLTSDPGEHSH